MLHIWCEEDFVRSLQVKLHKNKYFHNVMMVNINCSGDLSKVSFFRKIKISIKWHFNE